MRRTLALLVAGATLLTAVPLIAHHSFAAEFDADKPINLTGSVTKIDWMNPHVWFYVDVKESDRQRRELGHGDGKPERADEKRLDPQFDESRRHRFRRGEPRKGRQQSWERQSRRADEHGEAVVRGVESGTDSVGA